METIANIFQAEIIQRLGWTLVHFVWQGIAIGLILAIVLKLLHKSSANLRYLIACMALALIVLMPAVTIRVVDVSAAHPLLLSPIGGGLQIADTGTEAIVEMPQIESSLPAEQVAATERLSFKDRFEPALPYVVVGWLTGVLALSIWHLGGWRQLQKLRRRMVTKVEPALQTKLKQLSNILGIQRTIGLVESALVGVPTVVGHLKPVILLPASALTGLAPEQIEAILAHELAHIKRCDYLVNICQTVVEILGFYHPAVWWVSHKIRAERENCCDDIAVSVCNDSLCYARALTTMEEIRADRPSLAVAASGGNLFDRIRRLLGKNYADKEKAGWLPSVVAIVLIVSLLIPITFAMSNRPKPEAEISPAQKEPIKKPDVQVDEDAVKQDFKTIARQVIQYKMQNGRYPETLEQLNMTLPKDIYSTFGEDYHYESNRKRFILSSCGKDSIYGNDDDQVYYVDFDRREKKLGLRNEIYPLKEDDDQHSQTENSPRGSRPQGNCSISGKVVSAETGGPIDHATVYLFYMGTHAPIFISVASDGSFVFKNIPTGPFSLRTIRTAGFQDTTYNLGNKPGQVSQFSLKDGEQRSGIVFELKPACHISGRISDENGKLPANIGSLTILGWTKKKDGSGYENTRGSLNRGNGSYSIDGLGNDPVYVMAVDWEGAKQGDAYPPIYYPSTFSRNKAKPITFDKQCDVKNIDIQVRRTGGIVLEGTITAETGRPVDQAFVVIHHRDMLFDFATAYTDQKGHYQIDGLGEGEFLVHVDAVHRGFVRTRTPIDIDSTNQKSQLDFTLKRGVTISGKFVDADGSDWQIAESYGHANMKDRRGPTSSFSLTDFRNKYRPKDARDGSGGSFYSGEGDYNGGDMIFPTKSTFILQGMMPGQTLITFSPKKEGQIIKEILYNGQNIMETGIETKSGEEIKDVTIVIGKLALLQEQENALSTDPVPGKGELQKAQIAIEARFLTVDEDYLEAVGEVVDFNDTMIDDIQTRFLVRATGKHKNSKVLTAPKVTVFDGESAALSLVKDHEYISGYVPATEASGKPKPKYDSVETGTVFAMEPKLREDNNIFMDIEVTYSSIIDVEELMYEGKYPYQKFAIDKAEISTSALVPDGGTVLIDGPEIKSADDEKPQRILVLIKPQKLLAEN